MMVKIRWMWLVLYVLLSLIACNSQNNAEPTDKEYRQDFEVGYKAMKELSNIVKAREVSKKKYFIVSQDRLDKTRVFLEKYKDSEYSLRDSYRALKDTTQSFIAARQLWEEGKGLSLVGNRWEKAHQLVDRAEQAFQRETGKK